MGDAQSVSSVTSPWASLPLFAGTHLQDWPSRPRKGATKRRCKFRAFLQGFRCKWWFCWGEMNILEKTRYTLKIIIQKCNTIKHFAYFSACARITQKQVDIENVIAALEAQRNNVSMHDCRWSFSTTPIRDFAWFTELNCATSWNMDFNLLS